jgi:hypothetical protein
VGGRRVLFEVGLAGQRGVLVSTVVWVSRRKCRANHIVLGELLYLKSGG